MHGIWSWYNYHNAEVSTQNWCPTWNRYSCTGSTVIHCNSEVLSMTMGFKSLSIHPTHRQWFSPWAFSLCICGWKHWHNIKFTCTLLHDIMFLILRFLTSPMTSFPGKTLSCIARVTAYSQACLTLTMYLAVSEVSKLLLCSEKGTEVGVLVVGGVTHWDRLATADLHHWHCVLDRILSTTW